MRRLRREIEQSNKLTVERLSVDRLDIRELEKYGLLCDDRRVLKSHFRWPKIGRIIGNRYWLELEFPDRTTAQQIRVSWTPVHLGGQRPWMHCPYCQTRKAILLRGLGGMAAGPAWEIRSTHASPEVRTAGVISNFARSGYC
jgi:hypothetical protein